MHKFVKGQKVYVHKVKWPKNTSRTAEVLGKVFTISRFYNASDALNAYTVEESFEIYFDESELSAELVNAPLIKALE